MTRMLNEKNALSLILLCNQTNPLVTSYQEVEESGKECSRSPVPAY